MGIKTKGGYSLQLLVYIDVVLINKNHACWKVNSIKC